MKSIRPRVSAVVSDGERLLVVIHEKSGRRYHLLPGGGVDFGESVPDALCREVREETGLEIQVGSLLASAETIFPDGGRHILHLVFHAPSWRGELREGPEDERTRGARWLEPKELHDLPFLPDIRDFVLEQLASGCRLPARHILTRWIDVDGR